MKFDGKIAVVTGASSGIGRATAVALAPGVIRVGVARKTPIQPRTIRAAIERAKLGLRLGQSD